VASGLVARFRAARRDPTLVVLEGLHALKHALRFGAAIDVALALDVDAAVRLAERLAPDISLPLSEQLTPCPPVLFAQLAPAPPETGVIALARRPTDGEAALRQRPDRPVVVLDRPRHLGNLGAAIRVAAAADAAGVVVVGEADPWHPTAVRGAAGLQFALPCLRTDRATAIVRPLWAFDADGAPLATAPPPTGSALAFGGERHGLHPTTRAAADRVVALPMRAGVSSLNLATAVAAALYSLAPPAIATRDA